MKHLQADLKTLFKGEIMSYLHNTVKYPNILHFTYQSRYQTGQT